MASDSRRRGALALLALPIVAMMGLFAWAGSVSSQDAQGAGSPLGIARVFVSAIDAGDCNTAIALVGSSPLHQTPPTCQGFSNAIQLTSCTYELGTPPPASFAAKVAGYSDLSAVDVTCTALSHNIDLPVHLAIITGVRSSDGALRIVDFQELTG